MARPADHAATIHLQGGVRVLFWILIVAVQAALVALLVLEPMAAFAIIGALLLFLFTLRFPVLAVFGVMAARLMTTGALSFHVGSMSIGAFEPMYLMTFTAILIKTAQDREDLLKDFANSRLLIALLVWMTIGLAWAPDKGQAVAVIIRMGIAFALVWLVSSMIRTPDRFYQALWVWIGISCLYGLLGQILGVGESELYSSVSFEAMAGGGRVGGLGQHPNWFAMTLAFAVNPALALAYSERNRVRRYAALACAVWLIFCAMSTGSRGALGGIGLGSLFMALHNRRLLSLISRYWVVIALLFSVVLFYSVGSYGAAFYRIATRGLSTLAEGNVRFSNWATCWDMFVATFGMGVGTGGYEILVEEFNPRLSMSLYAYPHGPVWETLANHGVIGLTLLLLFSARLLRSFWRAARKVRGTTVELWLIGMAAGVVGYWAHGMVEFRLTDKPYWMFVGLLLGLIAAADRLADDPEELARRRRDYDEATGPGSSPAPSPPR